MILELTNVLSTEHISSDLLTQVVITLGSIVLSIVGAVKWNSRSHKNCKKRLALMARKLRDEKRDKKAFVRMFVALSQYLDENNLEKTRDTLMKELKAFQQGTADQSPDHLDIEDDEEYGY